MTRRLPLLAAPILLAACALVQAAPSAATSETDEARFVALTRQLEREPLADAGKLMRAWLLRWAEQSPDITALVCGKTTPMAPKEHPHHAELLVQGVFGNVAYQIEHPDKRGDEAALQAAAVRSTLRAYAALRSQSGTPAIPELDALAELEQAGTLDAHVAPLAAKCQAEQ